MRWSANIITCMFYKLFIHKRQDAQSYKITRDQSMGSYWICVVHGSRVTVSSSKGTADKSARAVVLSGLYKIYYITCSSMLHQQ